MSEPSQSDFYVGYLPKAPSRLGRRTAFAAAAVVILATAVAVALATFHREYGPGIFEYGSERAFEGVIRVAPHPVLEVLRPGRRADGDDVSVYPLVLPGKHGAAEALIRYAGKRVRLRGTIAYREGRTLVEIVPESIAVTEELAARSPTSVTLGRVTLRGEIVDAKCFLGVMNPGGAKPHRECAARCISGGIPPLLVVRDPGGRGVQLLLVGPGGRAINRAILDLVAEPVEISGEARREGDLLVLQADPATIRRLL